MITRKTIEKLPVIEVETKTMVFPYNKPTKDARLSEKGYIVILQNIKMGQPIGCACDINGVITMSNDSYWNGYRFDSFDEAAEWVKNNGTNLKSRTVKYVIQGVYSIYTCKSHNKETKDKNIALKWFKDYRIIYKIGSDIELYFMEVKSDYIDVFFYTYNSKEKIIKKRMVSLKDDSISQEILRFDFQQNCLGLVDEKGHLIYTRQDNFTILTLRRIELYNHYDIKRQVLGEDSKFSPDTARLLQTFGFETIRYSRGYHRWENAYRINTLMKFRRKQMIEIPTQTKISSEINEFLKDIPFDEQHAVVPFKGGYICRFARITQTWQECNWETKYRYTDSQGRNRFKENLSELLDPVEICEVSMSPTVQDDKPVTKLVQEKMVECYRLFINSSLTKRTVVHSNYGGKIWEPYRIDLAEYDTYGKSSAFSPKNPEFTHLDAESWNKKVWETLFTNHPKLKYLKNYVNLHPSINGKNDIKFLRAACDYQKIIETFIALNKDDIFWQQNNDGSENFIFDKFKYLMRLDKLIIHKRDDFYKNLGLTKTQFKTIFYNKEVDYSKIMTFLNETDWHRIVPTIVPDDGWRVQDQISRRYWVNIPNDYFEQLIKIYVLLGLGYQNPTIKYTIVDFIEKGFTLKQILKYIEKGVDINLYKDYLRMREDLFRHLTSARAVVNFDPNLWEKKLSDAEDVRHSHDRLLFIYNQWQAERERINQIEQAKEEKKKQDNYELRYKTLKYLNYQEDDKVIVVPKKLLEIIVEGQTLHHCVGSFVTSVSQGRDTIVFLRHKDTPDIPYATISLLPTGKSGREWVVDQAHTSRNGDISKEDVEFLKRWGKEKGVAEKSIQTHYGAKCHH